MRILLITTHSTHEPPSMNPGQFSPALLGLKYWLEEVVEPRPEVHVRVYAYYAMDRFSWVEDLRALKPDILGLSCFFWNIEVLLRLARMVRQHLAPQTRIVLGGSHVSSRRFAQMVLPSHPEVDALVRGEGEIPLAGLVRAWGQGEGIHRVPGISFMRDGQVAHNEPPRPLKNLDVLPSPFVSSRRQEVLSYLSHSQLAYQTYRGCRRRCKYCVYHMGGLRFHSLDRVDRDLSFILRSLKPPYLRIIDSHFGGSRARALEILDILARHNRGSQIMAFHDVRFIDREYLEACERVGAANGLSQGFGFQSSSEAVLAMADRRGEMEAFKRAMGELRAFCTERRLPFRAAAQYIIGLPGDSYETFLRTLTDVMRSGAKKAQPFTLLVLPGTPFYEEAENLGIKHFTEGNFRVISTPTFPEDKLQRAMGLAAFVEAMSKELPTVYRELCRHEGEVAGFLDGSYDIYLNSMPKKRPSTMVRQQMILATEGAIQALGPEEGELQQRLIPALRLDLEGKLVDEASPPPPPWL